MCRIWVFIVSCVRVVTGSCHCSVLTGWLTRQAEISHTGCVKTVVISDVLLVVAVLFLLTVEADAHFTIPWGVESWVNMGDWLHTEIVYLRTESGPIPWRPQTMIAAAMKMWKTNAKCTVKLNLTSLDKFHQVGFHGLWLSWLWPSWSLFVAVIVEPSESPFPVLTGPGTE